jgi:hypothetical protein
MDLFKATLLRITFFLLLLSVISLAALLPLTEVISIIAIAFLTLGMLANIYIASIQRDKSNLWFLTTFSLFVLLFLILPIGIIMAMTWWSN